MIKRTNLLFSQMFHNSCVLFLFFYFSLCAHYLEHVHLKHVHLFCISVMYRVLPGGSRGEGSGGSISVVLSSPAKGKLCPPSNIPNTATEYFVPALRTNPDNKLQQNDASNTENKEFIINVSPYLSSSKTTVLSYGPTSISPRFISLLLGWNVTL